MDLSRSIPDSKLTGIDISPAVIETNRTKISDAEFFTVDIEKEMLPTKFDAVVCMEVVEHCQDYKDAIKRLADMTEKFLFITVPCGPVFEIDRRVGHKQHFKSEEIVTALTNEGLHVVKLQEWGFPFFNLYKHVINLWPDKMSDSFLSQHEYSFAQKIISTLTYAAFKLCVPKWGYQLFVMAERKR